MGVRARHVPPYLLCHGDWIGQEKRKEMEIVVLRKRYCDEVKKHRGCFDPDKRTVIKVKKGKV